MRSIRNWLHFNRHVRRPLRRALMLMAMVGLMLMGVISMTVLAADQDVDRKEAGLQSYPVTAGEIIYKGAMVCVDKDGYLVAAADTASYKFVGIAYEKIDNSGGGDGVKNCRVHTRGVFLLTCTGINQTMVGQMMYVKDDDVVDDTSTNWICVGRLVQYVGSTQGWVDIGDRQESEFGKDAAGPDVTFYSKTAGKVLYWDRTTEELVLDNADLHIGDGDNLRLGDHASGDFRMQWGGVFLECAMAEAGKRIEWGGNAAGYDCRWFGDADNPNESMFWDASVAELVFDNADIHLGDGDLLRLGDEIDFTLQFDGTAVVAWVALAATQVRWGANGAGMDHMWYGDVNQQNKYLLWDASLAILNFVGNAKPAVDGVVGVDFGPADATSFTVKRGIITAIS